jgi:diguanylate cyclase (GGDEF)-like protein
MISLKKYMDTARTPTEEMLDEEITRGPDAPRGDEAEQIADIRRVPIEENVLGAAVAAYRSALREMGNSSVEACPGLGTGLKVCLGKLDERLAVGVNSAAVEATELAVREQLQDWGRRTAAHYRAKTGEVKDLLLVMARTAESVGERDQRCAGQISEVTTRLKTIASLEDLTEIRASIERSAADLKTSLDRMAAEGKQAIAVLEAEVSSYQVKLEEAEELASRDSLTGLRNRAWVEAQMERRMAKGAALSVAIVDVDDFKRVNDRYGHLVGDEILRKFARELKTGSRATDVIGRWGGDEFILVLDCGLGEAGPQIERLSAWVCQDYPVQARSGATKLTVRASIGLAERWPGEAMKDMLARADAAMYARKADGRGKGMRR